MKDKSKIVTQTIKSSKDLSGILTILSENRKFVVERSPKREMFKADVMRGKVVDNNKNLLLFGQYSHQKPSSLTSSSSKSTSTSTTVTQTASKTSHKSCIVCAPNGLTTTALTMNLSAIGPLCTNIGCMGVTSNSSSLNSSSGATKEANSRMSRSASPAPSTENNTRLIFFKLENFFFLKFTVF